MPAQWCKVSVLALAALGAVVAEGEWNPELDETLNSDDQVHLLQEKVAQRSKDVKAKLGSTDLAVPHDAPEQKAAGVCESAGGVCESLADAPADEEPLAAGLQLKAAALAPEAETQEDMQTYALIFRACLVALIVLILVDGCRRWQRGEACPDSAESFKELMRAAMAGDEARARQMLKKGASPSAVDFWGCTALHAGAKGGMQGLCSELLSRGAEVNAADSWKDTPLHMAARAGHADVCKMLLAKGAHVDAVNAESFTPLVVAGHAEREDACLLLMSKGASMGKLSKEDAPLLLKELSQAKAVPEAEMPTIIMDELEEKASQWPTEEDWEQHMKETIDDCTD